ncbi:MAG TPA: hypothetical protein VKS21_13575 [Spirochaetota bacterium]|nr:hypothetical protein [Spirochaetota bacterium]
MKHNKIFLLFIILWSLNSCSKDYETKYQKAYGYMEKNEIKALEKAVDTFDDAFQAAVASLQGKYDALLALGIKMVQNKMYLQAANLFDKAVKSEAKYRSNYLAAAEHFDEARRIMPLRGEAYYRLGLCYGNYANILSDRKTKKQYIDKAEHTFKTGLNVDRENPDLYYGLGILYIHIKSRSFRKNSPDYIESLKKARDYFEKALKFSKLHIPALFGAAKAHYLLGSFQWAGDYLKKIKKNTPENSRAWKQADNNLQKIRGKF